MSSSGQRAAQQCGILSRRGKDDKKQLAMQSSRFIKHHPHFNVQPYFEWDFRAWLIVIDWFKRAAACPTDFEATTH